MNLTKKLKLTAAKVKALSEPGRYHDGHGLMLVIQPGGSKSWIQRLVIQGKRRDFGLGGYPLVMLAEARDKAFANRRIARAGGDPRHQSGSPTFAECARKVHVLHSPAISNERYRKQWIDELDRYAFPTIGTMPVDQIAMRNVMDVIEPIWHSKPKLAKQLRQRIEKVFDWIIVQGHRPDNPAGVALKAALPVQGSNGKHHDAIPHAEVGKAIEAIRAGDRMNVIKMACEFVILTAGRSGEIREARWEEIDLESRTWTVPKERMKTEKTMKKDHVVPLSDRAIEILEQAREIRKAPVNERSGLVFPNRGKALSDSALLRTLKEVRQDATIHGFRSSFRTWCQDTEVQWEVGEACIAHNVGKNTEQAYARSNYFEPRVKVMQDWADYLKQDRP